VIGSRSCRGLVVVVDGVKVARRWNVTPDLWVAGFRIRLIGVDVVRAAKVRTGYFEGGGIHTVLGSCPRKSHCHHCGHRISEAVERVSEQA
jgi:hypothetical protein